MSSTQGKTVRCYACGQQYDPAELTEHARRTYVATCKACIFSEIDAKYEDTTTDFRG